MFIDSFEITMIPKQINLKGAKIVPNLEVKENITDLDLLDDFLNIKPEKIEIESDGRIIKAKIIKSLKENAFYKKSSGEWFRWKIGGNPINPEVIEWANKLKDYLGNNLSLISQEIIFLKEETKAINTEIKSIKTQLNSLDNSLKEGLEQTNELTDLKIKNFIKTKKGEKNWK